MGYPQFLENLFEDGRVVVSEIRPISAEELREGDEILAGFDCRNRLELPAPVPQFQKAAGRWAAEKFFLACQFAVYRDEPAETVDEKLSGSLKGPIASEDHYSVDLVFRYLPDLMRFAASAAEEDPLVGHLRGWAQEWPLSSVGMPEVKDVAIEGFATHPSLLQLYADRIIATGDTSRLSDLRAREAVQASLGLYPDLAPTINAALKQSEEVEDTTS